jgi:hypothetical protein
VNRKQLVSTFVLDVIADDYESLEKIYTDVAVLGTHCGMLIEKSEIFQALLALVESGLASAYILTTEPVQEIRGVPPLDQMNDYYYWVTDKGKQVVLADCSGWPFDDDFHLRKDWSPPRE